MYESTGLFDRSRLGYLRVATIAPAVRVADVAYNVEQIEAALREAAGQGVQLAVFPELCITAYSCADLFYQGQLLAAASDALPRLAQSASIAGMACVVGVPLMVAGRLYNCAALLADGHVAGIVPKRYLPTTGEFYEQRWFTAADRSLPPTVAIGGVQAPFGTDLLF
ncbi:MAG: NAD(+) synthase, partial [Caldilinea sp.]|nr:NAD(+) synthase [Caldilinea sp.]